MRLDTDLKTSSLQSYAKTAPLGATKSIKIMTNMHLVCLLKNEVNFMLASFPPSSLVRRLDLQKRKQQIEQRKKPVYRVVQFSWQL